MSNFQGSPPSPTTTDKRTRKIQTKQPKRKPQLRLICLDLDETLVHVEVRSKMISCVRENPSLYRKVPHNFTSFVPSNTHQTEHSSNSPLVPNSNIPSPSPSKAVEICIFYRPHLTLLLSTLQTLKSEHSNLKIAITTAAQRNYAKAVLREITKLLNKDLGDLSTLFDVTY